MKLLSLPRIEFNRRYFLSVFAIATLMLSLALVCQRSYAQQQTQLTLADILIALRSKKAPLEEKNKLLTEAVKMRGITFALTPELEKELETTGASKDLVEAVRSKSVVAKAMPQPSPVATPTPVPTPPEFAVYQQRADAHMVKGEYDLAVADYNKVIALNPKSAGTYLSRGLSYYYKQSYNEAISDYNKGIELAPNESMAYYNRGDSYEKLGDAEKAVADYQKAVTLDPNNENAKKALKRIQDEQAKAAQAKAEQPKTFTQPRPQETSSAPAVQPNKEALKQVSKESPKEQPKEQSKEQPQLFDLGRLSADRALKMTMPIYSPDARKFGIAGQVTVQVNLDEEGNVTSAKAKSGPGPLRGSAEDAARRSKFKPAVENGAPVKSTGLIVYDFKVN